MAISSDIIAQFVKVTNDETKIKSETTVYGTIVEQGGSKYVRLDGSELLTPITTTANVADGERVAVLIKNHTATVTGNMSSPAARMNDIQDTTELMDKITELEILIAYRITTEDLQATNAIFESLKAKTAKLTNADIVNAAIDSLHSKYTELEYVMADDVDILNADIENLKAIFGTFADISAEDLEAINADIDNLKSYNANFTYVSAEIIQANKAEIVRLGTEKLSTKDAEVKFANIDFSNIGKAAMEYLYSKSGLIQNVVIGDATITGKLVGVTISGDLIEGSTVKADKLVIKGSDGLYYKLNTDGMVTEAKQTDQNSINGSIIKAKSITASKISVDDLVAFGATIGGFHITDNSIYSGVKDSVGNTTHGIYLDNDGQIAFGDSDNYVKFYKDANGNYKLAISAESIFFGSSKKTADEVTKAATDALETVQKLKERADSGEFGGEDATVLRIDSSRGTVFKNSQVSTVLSAVIYKGSKRITDITALRKEYGDSAYLEWQWQKMGENTFGTILSTDSRIGQNGFTFTLSPEDVDTKVVFMCQLITE